MDPITPGPTQLTVFPILDRTASRILKKYGLFSQEDYPDYLWRRWRDGQENIARQNLAGYLRDVVNYPHLKVGACNPS